MLERTLSKLRQKIHRVETSMKNRDFAEDSITNERALIKISAATSKDVRTLLGLRKLLYGAKLLTNQDQRGAKYQGNPSGFIYPVIGFGYMFIEREVWRGIDEKGIIRRDGIAPRLPGGPGGCRDQSKVQSPKDLLEFLRWELKRFETYRDSKNKKKYDLYERYIKGKHDKTMEERIEELTHLIQELEQTPYGGDPIPERELYEVPELTEEQWEERKRELYRIGRLDGSELPELRDVKGSLLED